MNDKRLAASTETDRNHSKSPKSSSSDGVDVAEDVEAMETMYTSAQAFSMLNFSSVEEDSL